VKPAGLRKRREVNPLAGAGVCRCWAGSVGGCHAQEPGPTGSHRPPTLSRPRTAMVFARPCWTSELTDLARQPDRSSLPRANA